MEISRAWGESLLVCINISAKLCPKSKLAWDNLATTKKNCHEAHNFSHLSNNYWAPTLPWGTTVLGTQTHQLPPSLCILDIHILAIAELWASIPSSHGSQCPCLCSALLPRKGFQGLHHWTWYWLISLFLSLLDSQRHCHQDLPPWHSFNNYCGSFQC